MDSNQKLISLMSSINDQRVNVRLSQATILYDIANLQTNFVYCREFISQRGTGTFNYLNLEGIVQNELSSGFDGSQQINVYLIILQSSSK